jgi:septal ring factor EnvC (AmiA/AmiB activator)
MEHRIEQLERKLAEQEQTNSGLRADIKSLKEIQHGNRTEYLKGFEYYEHKKKKFSGLLGDANTRVSAIQDQQQLLATKAELQYVTHTPYSYYQTKLTFARSLSAQLDELKYVHTVSTLPLILTQLTLRQSSCRPHCCWHARFRIAASTRPYGLFTRPLSDQL